MLKKIQKRVAEHCPLNLVWEKPRKTQIAAILKNETELRAAYATYRGNNPGNNKRACQGRYREINEALYKWYSLARESLVSINGPMLQEEAAEIAKQLAKPEYAEFKASSGWLEKWKNAYGISQRSIEGNLVKSRSKTIEAWMERLPEICRGYKLEDIWNMDESGCLFSCIARHMSFGKREALQGRQTLKSSYDRCFHCQCNWWEGNRPNCYLEK